MKKHRKLNAFDSYRGAKWRNIFLGISDSFLSSKGDVRVVYFLSAQANGQSLEQECFLTCYW